MDQTMQHFNQYSSTSPFAWDGLQSNRFGKTRIMLPNRDLIKSGFDIPDETVQAGRKHYNENRSSEYVFRPKLKQFPSEMEHWHLRESSKRVRGMEFSQPHPRREREHYKEPVFEHTDKFAGIRTFYNSRLKEGQKEYLLQDRIQRKVRVDQLQIRRNAFKDESYLQSKSFQKYRL